MLWYQNIAHKIVNNWFGRSKARIRVEPSEFIGAFPVRQDITVLPADDPKKLRLGWTIYEEVGIVVINDYALSHMNSDVETEPVPKHIYPQLRGWRR
jgi:hypothetical protein